MKNINEIFSISTGSEFECNFNEVIISNLKKNGNMTSFKSFIGSEIDHYEGADAEVYGVRVDFTHAFSTKNHMIISETVIETKYADIKFGIRTGNDRKMFDIPVVVIGIDVEYVKPIMTGFFEEVSRNINNIIDTACDVYYDYVDSMEVV